MGSSRMRGDLQEDSILSARPGDISAPQMAHDQSLRYPDDHYNSQDTRVLHSVVKQKVRGQDYQHKQFASTDDSPGLHIRSDLAGLGRRQQLNADDQSHLANRDIAAMVYAQQQERSSNPSSMSPAHTQIVRPTLPGGENEQHASDGADKQELGEDSAPSKTASVVVKDDDHARSPPMKRAPLPSTQLDQHPPGAAQSVSGPREAQSMAVDEVANDEELDHDAPSTGQGKKNAMNKTQD